MSETPACLLIADESAEFPAALTYAAALARTGGWRIMLLRVIEPEEPAPWASVGEEMRRQAQQEAEARLEYFSAAVFAESGTHPVRVIRTGDARTEIAQLVDSDPAIKLIVLGAGDGAGGPGPLVAAIGKGQLRGARAAPAMIVPGGLSLQEARALAAPQLDPNAPKRHLH